MRSAGIFHDETKEFVITEMHPPRPWLNYLWNGNQVAITDQFGFGPGWNYTDAVRTNLCRVKDNRLIFLRDEKTKEFWAANRNYEDAPFEEFYTVVGQGYSKIVSLYRGLRVTFTIIVPVKGNCECWKVEIENVSKQERNLSVFAYADADINISGHLAYNHGSYDSKINGIMLSHHGFALNTEYTNISFAADTRPFAYETSNRRFRGVYGCIQDPDCMKSNRLSSLDTSFDPDMICALQFKLLLKQGKSRTMNFRLGLSRDRKEAIESCKPGLLAENFTRELGHLKLHVDNFSRRVVIETPDDGINRMCNIWLKRQMDFGLSWGRGYAKGFRDIMQDLSGFMSLSPDKAGERIKYCLAYQYENGNTLREWEPELHHPYRDGAVWIVPAVAGYIKETGDISILREKIPFYKSSLSGDVLEHCRRGMDFLFSELGKHGLCLWGGGDWNDSLNNAGLRMKGESVWLSEAAIVAGKEYVNLLDFIVRNKEADLYRKKIKKLSENLLSYAFEKDHFLCGYTDWDEKVGSYKNKEGKLFLNMQTWAVLAGILNTKESHALMDLVEKKLSCPFGYVLMKPSYSSGDDHIGRVSYMEKGAYENGSVYNHGVAFKIAADCALGRGNKAFATILKILVTNKKNDALHSGVEPYAITNMYLGPENKLRSGEAVMGWITGTAGWLYRCIIENMAGIKPSYNGLTVDPCLPSSWKEIKVRREYRGTVYDIRVLNPLGLETGKLEITVDNQTIPTKILPIFTDKLEHKVVVTMS